MAIDASIPLQIKPFQLQDPLESYGRMLAIRGAQRQFTMDEDISQAAQMTNAEPGAMADELLRRGHAGPAMQLRHQQQQQAALELQTKREDRKFSNEEIEHNLKIAQWGGERSMMLDTIWNDALKKNGGDPVMAIASIQPVYTQVRQQAMQVTNGKAKLPEAFDPDVNRANIGNAKNAIEYLKSQHPQYGAATGAINPATGKPDLYQPPGQNTTEGRFLGVTPAASPAQPTDLAKLQSERATIAQQNPKDPRLAQYDDAIEKATTHQPAALATASITQEKGENKIVGEGFGKRFNEIQDAGFTASGKISRLDRMQNLLDGVRTGKLQPKNAEIAAIADSLGIKVDKTLGAKQALDALSNELALQLRNPSGGAGMPGAMSDPDREFLVSMTPGLAKTPEGNKLIIETARKLAQREQQVAKLARDYRRKNGQLDEGFYDVLQTFSDSHPLFNKSKTNAPTPPNSGTSVQGAAVSSPDGTPLPAQGTRGSFNYAEGQDQNITPMGPPVAGPKKDPAGQSFEVGKIYKDANGHRGKYVGGGQWQPVK